LETGVDTVPKAAQDYYGTWDDKSPIQREWIKDYLESLHEWGLAAKENNRYKIDLQKPKEKDLEKYFCEKLCAKETFFGGELEREQKVIPEFRDAGVIKSMGMPRDEKYSTARFMSLTTIAM